jgi:hypothetical protein
MPGPSRCSDRGPFLRHTGGLFRPERLRSGEQARCIHPRPARCAVTRMSRELPTLSGSLELVPSRDRMGEMTNQGPKASPPCGRTDCRQLLVCVSGDTSVQFWLNSCPSPESDGRFSLIAHEPGGRGPLGRVLRYKDQACTVLYSSNAGRNSLRLQCRVARLAIQIPCTGLADDFWLIWPWPQHLLEPLGTVTMVQLPTTVLALNRYPATTKSRYPKSGGELERILVS